MTQSRLFFEVSQGVNKLTKMKLSSLLLVLEIPGDCLGPAMLLIKILPKMFIFVREKVGRARRKKC